MPKRKKAGARKPSRRSASAEFQRRSRAAKKGWKTRRRNLELSEAVEVRSGYSSSKDNSFTLIIHMQRRPDETDSQLSDRIEKSAAKGEFNARAPRYGVSDLGWATFHNSIIVTPIAKAPKKPRLVGFERTEP